MSSQYIPIPTGLGTEPISPPLSPPNNCAMESPTYLDGTNDSNSSHEGSKISVQDCPTTPTPKVDFGERNSKRPNRYRFKFCDIPAELLEIIKTSEAQKNGKTSFSAIIAAGNSSISSDLAGNTKDINSIPPTTSISADVLTASPNNDNNDRVTLPTPIQTQSQSNIGAKGSIKISGEKRHRVRKNPYPKRSPSKSSPGITFFVDIFTPLKENPKALLFDDDSSPPHDNSSPLMLSDDVFSSSESMSEG
ncbi:14295_t:CDS:1, partial [Acaulospora morrowiae]